MRLIAVLAAIWFALSGGPGFAGDSASFAPLGYSEDNRYFAYEVFSIGDEATRPFASVGVVDLETGADVPGSPFTADAGEETFTTISDLRLAALTGATEALSTTAIADPADFLALIGDGMRDDGTSLTFALPQGADPAALGAGMQLSLVTLPALIDDACSADVDGKAVGFELMLESEGVARSLHHHDATESVAGCLRLFRIYGVMQPYNGGGASSLVAVISVYSRGFEGYDRRFMVIPFAATDPDR